MSEISLTENAARRVAWIAERQSRPAVLRLAVDGGGCAGFTYKFELADHPESDDAVAETDGVTINTVRTQLKSIFAKTNTSRQAQLVRLFANMPIPDAAAQ